ncbi:stromal cell-derived factor 2 [Petromyzon marinus]|uniref:Stromal cell-derived factor 2-like n=1 Tax=Petromyzon marinus TaxID=7757 RepID=A0AAJ7UKJ9_PETMA|nr:stromal cell-derived factor 2-like [Petromyzon marinus]
MAPSPLLTTLLTTPLTTLLTTLLVVSAAAAAAAAAAAGGGGEAGAVTCGSLLKLLNSHHGVRLHSHDVKYGSGSGQQSVTGVEDADDGNSYWRVRSAATAASPRCQRGQPVRCGQAVRLTHVNTGRNLHSHHFSSPLSGNQEVSAFGEGGEGDELDAWEVQCPSSSSSTSWWSRDVAVRLRHVATGVFLSVTGERYGRPISGQREVHAMATPGAHNLWQAAEGVFLKTPPVAAEAVEAARGDGAGDAGGHGEL